MKTSTKIYFSALILFCGMQLANAQLPPVEAPTPPYDAANVKSFISDKYVAIKELNGSPNWGQTASYTFVEVGEEGSAMKISNLGEKGWLPIQFTSGEADIRYFDYVHFDIYCNENTSFRVGFHSTYQYNGLHGEYYGPFVSYTTPGVWVSYYYPTSALTDQGFELNHVQFIRLGYDLSNPDTPAGISYSNEIYLNNLFVFNGEPGGNGIKNKTKDDLINIYPSIVKDNLSLESIESIAKVSVYNIAGQKVATFNINSTSDKLDLSNLSSGSYIISAQLTSGKTITKRIIKL